MTKEHWKHLKETDPIHYQEMRGDPVTGLNNNTFDEILSMIFFVGFWVSVGVLLYKLLF